MTPLHPLQFEADPAGCPLCAAHTLETVARQDRNGGPLQTALCQECGHVFVHPMPATEALERYYAAQYREHYKDQSEPKRKHVYRAGLRGMERLDRLHSFTKPPGTLLDIGAGGGEFVHLAGRAGWDAAGIEPHEGYAAFARATYEANVVTAPVSALDEDASCDVITLHHVLEHLPNPEAALGAMHKALKPGGLLCVEVPDVMSTAHSPGQKFHIAHLHHFTRTGLETLITNAGFKILDSSATTGQSHLNVIGRKEPVGVRDMRDTSRADIVKAALNGHTWLAHHFSHHPYRRLWANAVRPVHESLGLRRLGDPETPKAILDSLFDSRR